MKTKIILTLLLCGLAIASIVACSGKATPTPIVTGGGVRGIFPVGTPTPAGYSAGLVIFQDLAATITPQTGVSGSHWQIYWSQRQPNTAATPNWTTDIARVSYIAAQGEKAWLSLTFFEESLQHGVPNNLYLPSGIPTVTFYTNPTGCAKTAPNYASATFQDTYDAAIINLLTQFGSDSNVAGFILELGSTGETMNVFSSYGDALCPNSQSEFEKYVTGEQYLAWVKKAMKTWRTYTTKPLYIAVHEMSVSYLNEWKSAQKVMEFSWPTTATPPPSENPPLTPTPLFIGYRSKALQADIWDAWQSNDWGKLQAGLKFKQNGGTAFTPGYGISGGGTANELTGSANMMVYQALAAGTSNLFFQNEWLPYIDTNAMYAITKTVGTIASDSPAVWLVLRSAEYPTIFGNDGINYYGTVAELGHLANVYSTSAKPTPACVSAIATTVAGHSGYEPPYTCKQIISGTPAPEARNVNFYPASSTLKININDAWQYAWNINNTYTVSLRYLDNGTGTITLSYKSATGVTSTHITTRTNTNNWLTDTFAITAALANKFSSTYDLEIVATTNGMYIYRIFIEFSSGTAATATPTATVTGTRTKVPSSTPTVTRTPTGTLAATSTATNTPTTTPTPANTYTQDAGASVTTTLFRNAPDTNYGANEYDYAFWQTNQLVTTALLRFPDLAKPTGTGYTEILTATLTLHMACAWCSGIYITARLYPLSVDWSEMAATWNDTGVGGAWYIPGALGAGDRGIIYTTKNLPSSDTMTTVTIDVTTHVRTWLDNSVANYGWGLYLNNPFTSTGTLLESIGSDEAVILGERPSLNVIYGLANTPTPTNTPTNSPTAPLTFTPTSTPTATPTGTYNTSTPTNTPTRTSTPTSTSTADATRTSTPTPAPNLVLNEVCVQPLTDNNLDGKVTTHDRAIEILNWTGGKVDLRGYRLEFSTSMTANLCQSNTDTSLTYIFPRYSYVAASDYKVIYDESLVNLVGEDFDIPQQGTISLCNPAGTLLDVLHYNLQTMGTCWAKVPNGGNVWLFNQTQSLGKLNP